MTISPKDIEPKVEEKYGRYDRRVGVLETKIDRLLRKRAPTPREAVQYKLPMKEPTEVVERILADYTAAGWTVDRYDEMCGITQLVFKYIR